MIKPTAEFSRTRNSRNLILLLQRQELWMHGHYIFPMKMYKYEGTSRVASYAEKAVRH